MESFALRVEALSPASRSNILTNISLLLFNVENPDQAEVPLIPLPSRSSSNDILAQAWRSMNDDNIQQDSMNDYDDDNNQQDYY
jgi:hypothetical protein